MGDNISRQATLEAIQRHFNPTGEEMQTEVAAVLAGVGVVISTQPSTDRKGHWEIYDHVDRIGRVIGEKICVCDQCKETMTLSWRAKVPNFCPHCGADMRGEQNE